MKHFRYFPSIFLLLFCTESQLLFSQKVQQKQFTVYINNAEQKCSVKAEVRNKKTRMRYSDTLKYYWYSADKIIITQGASDGKILNGKYSSFYYNNNLKEKGHFKKGLQNGHWMKWSEAGTLQEISNWNKGYRQGKQIVYDSVGNKISEIAYKKGKLHGESINYSNGKVSSKKKFKKGIEVLPGEEKGFDKMKSKLHSFSDKAKQSMKRKPKAEGDKSDKKETEKKERKEKSERKKEQSSTSTSPTTPAISNHPIKLVKPVK